MADDKWDMKVQLEVGDRGEQLFMEKYPGKIELFPGREYDFTCLDTGAKIELKTDTYNMTKSNNFFMERFSDVHKETPGGPWRAERDNIDIFVYYFVRHNTWFQFTDLPQLVERLNLLTTKNGLVYIKNKGWVTGGYKINRDKLADLYTIFTF